MAACLAGAHGVGIDVAPLGGSCDRAAQADGYGINNGTEHGRPHGPFMCNMVMTRRYPRYRTALQVAK